MPVRVTLTMAEGSCPGSDYVFEGRTICTVGRAEDCYLRLPNHAAYWDVSRHHCLLEIDPPEVQVRDLGSRNGTYVNGRKIGQRAEHQPPEAVNVQEFPAYSLHEGDEIKLGSALLRVHIAATPDQNNAEGVAQVGRPSPGVETPGEDGPAKSQPLTSRRPTTSRLRSVRMLWQSFCERFLQRWPWDRGGCKLAAR